MNGWLARLVKALAGCGAGAVLGYALGAATGLGAAGAAAGAILGIGLIATIDAWRAHRLLLWLRAGPSEPAPHRAGFWAELGYRIERALRQREGERDSERDRLAQFLRAIDASPNGVLLLDAQAHIDWCNATAADHLGIDPQRDRQLAVTSLVRAPAFVAHLGAGGGTVPFTLQLPGRDATLSVLMRRYGQGQRLVITQDITERQRAETMRRDFVANVSHEIRTPLTVLTGFVDTLRELPLTEVERHRVLDLMRQQTERMQSLVKDLLTLAQLEGSPRPAADRWLSVDDLLARAQCDAELLSQGRHVLEFGAAAGTQLAGDAAELQGALGNLVANAIRYTPEGGRIGVHWQQRANGSAQIEVEDTGIGIAAEHHARLGQRFYRVDSSRSRDSGGTGLGLAIVKHAVQRHGGALEVDSTPGKGSVFRLSFPAVRIRTGRDHSGAAPSAEEATRPGRQS